MRKMCYAVGGIVDGVGCPRKWVERVELVLVFSLVMPVLLSVAVAPASS